MSGPPSLQNPDSPFGSVAYLGPSRREVVTEGHRDRLRRLQQRALQLLDALPRHSHARAGQTDAPDELAQMVKKWGANATHADFVLDVVDGIAVRPDSLQFGGEHPGVHDRLWGAALEGPGQVRLLVFNGQERQQRLAQSR